MAVTVLLAACGTSGGGDKAGAGGGGGFAAHGGQSGQAGASGAGGQGGSSNEIQTIIATYKTWEPLSATPVDISAEIFGLCRLPTAAEARFVDSVHGHYALRDWANPAASTAIAAHGANGFPVGAAIVKEKFASPSAGAPLELAALGMMIKRGADFDAAAGDWEFVYWDAPSGVSQGPATLAACAACHASPSATDFVFLDQSWHFGTGP